VHDVLSPLDVKLLIFNPYDLRVIAASRKRRTSAMRTG
jgi:hypothetical protein